MGVPQSEVGAPLGFSRSYVLCLACGAVPGGRARVSVRSRPPQPTRHLGLSLSLGVGVRANLRRTALISCERLGAP